jgi:hypothetical protein
MVALVGVLMYDGPQLAKGAVSENGAAQTARLVGTCFFMPKVLREPVAWTMASVAVALNPQATTSDLTAAMLAACWA